MEFGIHGRKKEQPGLSLADRIAFGNLTVEETRPSRIGRTPASTRTCERTRRDPKKVESPSCAAPIAAGLHRRSGSPGGRVNR